LLLYTYFTDDVLLLGRLLVLLPVLSSPPSSFSSFRSMFGFESFFGDRSRFPRLSPLVGVSSEEDCSMDDCSSLAGIVWKLSKPSDNQKLSAGVVCCKPITIK
jgi:hypothetical protein